jgi:hypothetical protein
MFIVGVDPVTPYHTNIISVSQTATLTNTHVVDRDDPQRMRKRERESPREVAPERRTHPSSNARNGCAERIDTCTNLTVSIVPSILEVHSATL